MLARINNLSFTQNLVLSKKEKEACDYDHVIPLLIGEDRSPSSVAELTEEEKNDPIISALNTAYKTAIEKYMEAHDAALTRDEHEYTRLSENYNTKYAQRVSHVWRLTILGFLFFIVGAAPGYLCGRELDRLQNLLLQAEEHKVLSESSVHRKGLLFEVKALETARLKVIQDTITLASEEVVEKLGELEDETDEALLKKLTAYRKIYASHFPGETLKVNGVAVSELIRKIQEDIS